MNNIRDWNNWNVAKVRTMANRKGSRYLTISPFVSPDEKHVARHPHHPDMSTHPTHVCHVPRYQHITERPPEITASNNLPGHKSPDRSCRPTSARARRAHPHALAPARWPGIRPRACVPALQHILPYESYLTHERPRHGAPCNTRWRRSPTCRVDVVVVACVTC